MENFKILAEEDKYYIPAVNLDAETGICDLSGESYIEQTDEFYAPIISWLHEYLQTIEKPLIFNLRLLYYNTSTSKKILEIIQLLKYYEIKGCTVQFNWFFDTDDTDIEEDIEDFKQITELKINLYDNKQED